MRPAMNLDRFRELRAQAADVEGLRHRTQSLLARRPLRSFDGLGHFIDAVLGDDEQCADSLARTVRMSAATLEQLRASELDPFSGPLEAIAYLAFLLGLAEADFTRLASIDHDRFARHSELVIARSGKTRADEGDQVRRIWARLEDDRATDL